jgi:hypothetical protein
LQQQQHQQQRRRQQRAATLIAAAAAAPAIAVGDDVAALKAQLRAAVEGTDRGVFGVPAAKRAEVLAAVEALEARSPVAAPLERMDLLAGSWRLLFTTITITVRGGGD